ncbi:hypothetical protein AK812_SmicGene23349 [Symbiodinium microadriaticum]|uniref:Uncharacterized protein n=1 Tax=Symbiodinium microadriaticum TaxID=2951 RepID=A0A1Q9DHK2_SYMMI|nr:hypothetical protein AK812_SmicGene23349 [Symbiodinium microadriaticum]
MNSLPTCAGTLFAAVAAQASRSSPHFNGGLRRDTPVDKKQRSATGSVLGSSTGSSQETQYEQHGGQQLLRASPAAGPAELTGEKVAERIMELMATSTTLAAHSNLNDENTDGQSYEIEDWGYKDEDEPEAKEEQELYQDMAENHSTGEDNSFGRTTVVAAADECDGTEPPLGDVLADARDTEPVPASRLPAPC